MIRMMFIIVVLSFLTINLLHSDDLECYVPTSFIVFDALSGEGGMGSRFYITPKKLNLTEISFKGYSPIITHQIIVDSICIKTITNFIIDFKNVKYSELNLQSDGLNFLFYKFKECNYDLIHEIHNTNHALIFFRNLKKYLGEKKINFKELNDLIDQEISSMQLMIKRKSNEE